MPGTVITYYSYKGGVGRSFTLANTAVLLARWGYRVLTVDWDLEAPGLHHYFEPLMTERQPTGGVVDLAADFRAGRPPADHVIPLDSENGALALLAAGRADESYPGKLQDIDWTQLYADGFAQYLEDCRDSWTADYDFVLIDSRTGISDISSICTAHLADRLVVVYTANEQNLRDVVDVVERVDRARDRMPYDRPRHLVLPVLSRLDNRVEYLQAEEWQRKCAQVVSPLFGSWLAKSVGAEQMVRHLTVPYVSYWSFGERLAVKDEEVPSADQVSFALETIAAVLAQHFDRTDLLVDNRDAYVAAARTRRREYDLDLLVSAPRPLQRITTRLIRELRGLGLRVEPSLSWDAEFLDQAREPARHLCLLVDGEVSRWQQNEAERFLRRALVPGGDQRQLLCVLVDGTDRKLLPGFLRNLRPLELKTDTRLDQVARALRDAVATTPKNEKARYLEVLQNTASVLRDLPERLPYEGRVALLAQTVRDVEEALLKEDPDLLAALTADLDVLGRAHGDRKGVFLPEELRYRVDVLLADLDRRMNTTAY
ncbi:MULTISPECIES: KGGVGR-motif variant AAA ATPase [Actinosynnema]|uniref:KGGVGR-motif variant AAA ATPase n=1 Tax=Actinosynnema TaxID=40566 RepID=UPI0020A2AE48|nr:ATP/GTP-binding protein [Actinosynnema pretiosum]MCP2098049.1 CobQ/CobB/MinD/ParA nucleotide binding domain-containing protein [Actinosynnema pretiosum]